MGWVAFELWCIFWCRQGVVLPMTPLALVSHFRGWSSVYAPRTHVRTCVAHKFTKSPIRIQHNHAMTRFMNYCTHPLLAFKLFQLSRATKREITWHKKNWLMQNGDLSPGGRFALPQLFYERVPLLSSCGAGLGQPHRRGLSSALSTTGEVH